MSAPWYDAVAEPRADAAWELYHENAKRGRNDGIPALRPAAATPDHDGLPLLALGEAPPAAAAPRSDPGAIPLRALSDLLAAAGRPLMESDPVDVFVAVLAVESLPRGVGWYDPAAHGLRILRGDAVMPDLERALAAPGILRRPASAIFLAANLDAATARAGERGYRDALVAVGRHLAALETAAATAGLRIDDTVEFYDREVDALLFLDGLSRSVVRVVAVGAARD